MQSLAYLARASARRPQLWRLATPRRWLSTTKDFDVVVLGGGPVGCEFAKVSASLGQTVAIFEPARGVAFFARLTT